MARLAAAAMKSIPSFLHFHNMADSMHNMLGLHYKSWVWTMK
jgi:hypothetical protein